MKVTAVMGLLNADKHKDLFVVNHNLPFKDHKEDLMFFKKTTDGGTLIVGRSTYAEMKMLGFRSGNRTVLEVSSKSEYGNVHEAMSEAFKIGNPVFVIGGSRIWEEAEPYITNYCITRNIQVYQEPINSFAGLELNLEGFTLTETVELSAILKVENYVKYTA